MKKIHLLFCCLYFSGADVVAQAPFKADKAVDISRIGLDGVKYDFTMSDTVPTVLGYAIPHLTLFAGMPAGMHSTVALEDTKICCAQDSLTAVIGILDNSGPFRHVLRLTQSDFYMRATEADGVTGEYHVSNGGISFVYRDNATSGRWLLSNKAGNPGQALVLNTTGDTAQWKNINNFASVSWFNPSNNGNITLAVGSNIIEPANDLTALTINFPSQPINGDIVALSFVKPVGIITYSAGFLANATTKALAGNTFKYIYYAKNNKWYNW